MRLLLAEDELAMAEAVADILTYHQYSVDTALRGDDALRMIQAGGYDGVILDVMMPGMDGLQVLARMRDHGMRTQMCIRDSISIKPSACTSRAAALHSSSVASRRP